jgi:hypothetical protein
MLYEWRMCNCPFGVKYVLMMSSGEPFAWLIM